MCSLQRSIVLCALGLVLVGNIRGQLPPDSLGRYNDRHHKQGYWIQYLDEHLARVRNPEKASYFKYTYFDEGLEVTRMGYTRGTGKVDGLPPATKGSPVLLDGAITTYWTNGNIQNEYNFRKGIETGSQRYHFRTGGCVSEQQDHSMHYENDPHTYYMHLYYPCKHGRAAWTEGYYREEKGKWRMYMEYTKRRSDVR